MENEGRLKRPASWLLGEHICLPPFDHTRGADGLVGLKSRSNIGFVIDNSLGAFIVSLLMFLKPNIIRPIAFVLILVILILILIPFLVLIFILILILTILTAIMIVRKVGPGPRPPPSLTLVTH